MGKWFFSVKVMKRPLLLTALMCVAVNVFTAMPVAGAKPALTDRSISDAVEDELLLDPAVVSFNMDVTTKQGVVTLSGKADNILSKERAAGIARLVKGVQAVVNRIEVVPPLLRSDGAIRDDVKDALLTDPATDSFEVDVKVNDGVVTLSGTVDSWQEKQLCATAAKGVEGVTDLNNALLIDWPKKRLDEEIEAEVEKTLQWDAFVDHGLIDVEVKDGQVMLTGTVGSAAEKRSARMDAYVHGVQSVDDSRLQVKRWARDSNFRADKYTRKSPKQIKDTNKGCGKGCHDLRSPCLFLQRESGGDP